MTLSISFKNPLGRGESVSLVIDHFQLGGARAHHWEQEVKNKDDADEVLYGIDFIFHPSTTPGPRAGIDLPFFNVDGKLADQVMAGEYLLAASPYRGMDALMTWKVKATIAGTVTKYCD